MIKVLVGFITGIKDGGINKYLLNMLELLEDEDVRFDFLTSNVEQFDEIKEYLKQYSSNLFLVPRVVHPFKQEKAVTEVIKNNNYDICYFNISEAFNYIAMKTAYKCGIKKIYVHSHSSGNDTANPLKRKIFETAHYMCKSRLPKYATDFFSCSDLAGEWMYTKDVLNSAKYSIIYNAVDYNKFKYDDSVRNRIRHKMGLGEKIVIGHVGNFVYQKNIPYLLDIVKEIVKIDNRYMLLSAGEGPEWEEAKKKAEELEISNNIKFLGSVNNVNELMQAMDCFILPSRFEGLPIVGVEAQMSGLKCFFADTITKEVKLTDDAEFLPINTDAALWAKKITSYDGKRIDTSALENSDFDLRKQKERFVGLFVKPN